MATRIVIGTPIGSTNNKVNIRNLTTHYLLKLYRSNTRPVWLNGGMTLRSLSKSHRLAIYNLLRLRSVVKGSLK